MTTIRNILVPVDFSPPAEAALGLALEVAERLGASVTLLHVYGIPAYAFPEGFVLAPDILTKLAAGAQDAVEKLRAKYESSRVPLRAVSAPGIPDQEIIARAKAESVDLIVMGTHGRTGLKHVLLGSITERVVRLAPCPVLTVRGG
ncbi:MAG: universal stress protein [Deltaproteobacteria bacterium]|nr:universal stress protein [Deltaproteobacteria bacterium]